MMKKRVKVSLLVFLIIPIITILISYLGKSIETFGVHTDDTSVNLVLDSRSEQEPPSHFRKTSDKVNLKDNESLNLSGLNTLNISGSKQFSENGLAFIKKSIGDKFPITIVDLREESHGFINGMPVSWANSKNNANMGLTKEEVLADEQKKLQSIKLNEPIVFYNHPGRTVIPTKVQDENELVKSQSMSYVRIPVTDGKLPKDDMVDYFIELVNSQPKNTWLHFHCKQGIGRTTTFMIMYDIMKNAKEVNLEDIIKRQVLLSNMSSSSTQRFYSEERKNFFTNFYKYSKENNDNFKTNWSQWKKNSSINSSMIKQSCVMDLGA
ncbi:tyrosine phosphatase family protein [Clostridium argentinense CDC 2741]|uniref:Tyrosine phosphatase family protein n=2 Tax=Clostridium argentinense TaxID=29341 RepID=A0A0C1QX18_9CLOT|nr:phytase [Clostridium argentinense]ARC86681.1 phytase [Clostridium argentinense]KIE45542.1 tyrosine phosphatase family protein [Clostridium argentinense CDC 2741]NFF38420.1 phytase [Clostridium argentinense]NFP49386.1 phytase [Clostridium argentinense]NFP71789.1 phytase [Clostridium argentinense]